mmetsp:Transcript_77462/g.214635  ORF Transcript_77462/g.214635 Transcript_77462/m.214635 type:complete len:283 (-) Transcript_77462:211-1059(-)
MSRANRDSVPRAASIRAPRRTPAATATPSRVSMRRPWRATCLAAHSWAARAACRHPPARLRSQRARWRCGEAFQAAQGRRHGCYTAARALQQCCGAVAQGPRWPRREPCLAQALATWLHLLLRRAWHGLRPATIAARTTATVQRPTPAPAQSRFRAAASATPAVVAPHHATRPSSVRPRQLLAPVRATEAPPRTSLARPSIRRARSQADSRACDAACRAGATRTACQTPQPQPASRKLQIATLAAASLLRARWMRTATRWRRRRTSCVRRSCRRSWSAARRH